jgi:selenocysteine-specific elongation factor
MPDFACDRDAMALALTLDAAEVVRVLADTADVVPIPDAKQPEAWTTTEKWTRVADAAVELVTAAHREHPTEPGVEMERVRTQLPLEVDTKTFRWCLDRLVAARRLVRDESLLRSPSHRVALGAEARALGERLVMVLAEGGFTPPDLRQLEEALSIDKRRLGEVLGVLEKEGRVVRIAPDLFFAKNAAVAAQDRLTAYCREHGEITAAVFRDVIGASRKFAIAFLDWCDRTGVTTRVGDARRLRR